MNEKLRITREQQAHPHARARYLAQSIKLEEVDVSWSLKASVYIALAMTVGAITWAGVTEVTEIATASGEVVPAGLNHRVQHLEGGIVEEILVRNGDEVEAGQVLIRMSSTRAESQFEQTRVRKVSLALDAERISALLQERAADFSRWEFEFPELTAKQRTALLAQRMSFDEQIRGARAQIDRRHDEISQLRNEHGARAAELAVLQEQLDMRETVANTGQLARDDMLSLRAKLLERQTALHTTRDRITIARDAKNEAQIRVAEITNRYRESLQLEANQTAADLAEIQASLEQLSDRVNRTEIVSSVRGIVNSLTVNAIHSVIEPAETIMEIVPTEDTVIVESRVSPHDIGHLETGLPVDVRISTYDPARYGSAKGTLRHLSASTYLDDRQEPYYRAEIELAQTNLEAHGRMHRIIPGMSVQADIITGRKSILDYLLKPVYRGFNAAFHER